VLTIGKFWIYDRIYWALWYSAWLHFIVYSYTHQFPQLHLHCRCLVAASNSGRSSSSMFPNGPRHQLPASKSNSLQLLNTNSPLTNCKQLTFPAYGPHRNTVPLLLFTGSCLETAGCCNFTILALREYATIYLKVSNTLKRQCSRWIWRRYNFTARIMVSRGLSTPIYRRM
jgi:hypothetical protein